MRSRLRVASAGLVAGALFAPSTPAWAGPELNNSSSRTDEKDDDAYNFEVVDEEPEAGDSTDVETDGGEAPREPLYTMSYPQLATDPTTDEPCTRTRYILVYDEEARGRAADVVRLQEEGYAVSVMFLGYEPPPCSTVTIDLGAPARRAAEIVADSLDPAEPYLQPDNQAITGLRSFLDTGLDSDRTETVTVNLFGRDWDVEVRIVGTHTIDWGDGTVVSGITTDGGPWHDGAEGPDDIVHTYVDAGPHDIVVTTDWTITATLVGPGTTASDTARTTSAPLTVDVDEVRSVRDR